MGFMDKAKKMAEQAQSKLDEVQQQFNEKQGSSQAPPAGPAVEYDAHGRPVPAEEAVAAPHGDPVAAPPPPPPAPPAAPAPPASSAPPAPPAPPAPDVERPDEYAPPKLSSGDPLEG